MYILYHIFLKKSNGSGQARLMSFGAGPLRRAGLKKDFFIFITYFFYKVKCPLGIQRLWERGLYITRPAIQWRAGRGTQFRENLTRIQAAGKSKKIAYRRFAGGNSRRVARKRRVEHAQGCPGVLSMLIKKMSIDFQCSFQGLFLIFLCCLLQQTKISFSIITSSMPLWCSTKSSFPLINL